jgi:uncharacterized protein YifN (PemK superfamily)
MLYFFAMLRYQPKPGSVIYCNFEGFIVPEMIKKRPVIVVQKHRNNSKLVTVVPISTTAPIETLKCHVCLNNAFCNMHLRGKVAWVKCDMIYTVSLERLDLVKNKKTGKRYMPELDVNDFKEVKEAVRNALRL